MFLHFLHMPFNTIDSVKRINIIELCLCWQLAFTITSHTPSQETVCESVYLGSGLWAALLCPRPTPDKCCVIALTQEGARSPKPVFLIVVQDWGETFIHRQRTAIAEQDENKWLMLAVYSLVCISSPWWRLEFHHHAKALSSALGILHRGYRDLLII